MMIEATQSFTAPSSPEALDDFAARAAAAAELDAANDAVRKKAVSGDYQAFAAVWTPLLRLHGRSDLELKWHKEAIARGIDAYALVRAVEAAWLQDGPQEGGRVAGALVGRLDDLPFRSHGDLFHKRQILLMLNDYQRVFRYEDAGGAPDADRRTVHPGVLDGLYQAIWQAQRAGRPALAHLRIRIYAALAPDQTDTLAHLAATIVRANGEEALAEAIESGKV